MRHQTFECVIEIAGIVAGEAQVGARFQDAREMIQHLHLDEAPLVMACLRPRIREENKEASDRDIGQRVDDIAHIAFVDSKIPSPPMGERARVRGCRA